MKNNRFVCKFVENNNAKGILNTKQKKHQYNINNN